MGKLSNLTSGKKITAGTQIVKTICAQGNGNASRLLEEIGKSSSGSRIRRDFPDGWKEFESGDGWDAWGMNEVGTLVKFGSVSFDDRLFPLALQLGSDVGLNSQSLRLKDVSGSQCSLRPHSGAMILEVGSSIPQKRLESLATQIIGVWVVHGENWRDRKEKLFQHPWGQSKRGVFEKFSFEIVDGSTVFPRPTLSQLIDLGCRRSTHVGEWHLRHSTIISAIAQMPMTIHEFKKDGGEDICRFNGLSIGANPDIWGPYCQWNEEVRHSAELGMWKDLAMRSASPFNFQVHATRTLFPSIQLDSDYLLQAVGLEKLRRLLEVMVAEQSGRFYRLIDERGITYRQTGVSPELFQYANYGNFPRPRVVDNLMQTFQELQLIQCDAGHAMTRRPRVVMDSHAYIVIEALVRRQKAVHELSGRFMHAYLTDGSDAKMHRMRNEELFLLLRGFFGIQSMKFFIYPPLRWDSGLSSQYDPNLRLLGGAKKDWLARQI